MLRRAKRVICMLCNSVVVLSVMWPRRILSRWNMHFSWSKMQSFPYKILSSYLFFYLLQATATSCPLLLSGIMETHRAIDIGGLDLQVFDLSVRLIMWTRYRALMGVAVPNRQYVVTRLFAFTLNEVIMKVQLRMFQLWFVLSMISVFFIRPFFIRLFSLQEVTIEEKMQMVVILKVKYENNSPTF